jgi:signal transduction histidine kinase
VLTPILTAMRRLHGPRGIDFTVEAASETIVAVEAQDLAELMANLVDNAGKWARSAVRVVIERPTLEVARIIVDDDGPGLAPESWEIVFDLGQRLDERAPGSGLGLAIVRDLAHLYGGHVWLDVSPMGGLRATIEVRTVPPSA